MVVNRKISAVAAAAARTVEVLLELVQAERNGASCDRKVILFVYFEVAREGRDSSTVL